MSDDGEVPVFDGGKRALVRFAADGAALEQTSFPYTVINIYFPQFQVEPGGIVLWARAPMGPLKGDQPRLDRLLEDQGLKGGPCNSTPRDLVDLYGFAPTPQVI